MAHEMSQMRQQVGARPFNHSSSHEAEQEYDRLRDLARQEAGKRSSCFDKVGYSSRPIYGAMRLTTSIPGTSCIRAR